MGLKGKSDIEVKAIVNPADYWTKVLTMVAAGQAPDLMMVDYAFPSMGYRRAMGKA